MTDALAEWSAHGGSERGRNVSAPQLGIRYGQQSAGCFSCAALTRSELHEQIQRDGLFVAHSTRTLVEARKPTTDHERHDTRA